MSPGRNVSPATVINEVAPWAHLSNAQATNAVGTVYSLINNAFAQNNASKAIINNRAYPLKFGEIVTASAFIPVLVSSLGITMTKANEVVSALTNNLAMRLQNAGTLTIDQLGVYRHDGTNIIFRPFLSR